MEQKDAMKFEISIDDGDQLDLRSADLLRDLGFAEYTTFFIPLKCGLSNTEIKEIAEDFEIGGHTISHPQDLKLLKGNALAVEVGAPSGYLRKLIGKPIMKFAYPRGRFNDVVVEAVRKAGYMEARTAHVLKTDYNDPFRKPTTIHIYNGRKEYKGKGWGYWAYKLLDESPPYFHVWWHSWEVDRDGQWEALEKFLKYAKKATLT